MSVRNSSYSVYGDAVGGGNHGRRQPFAVSAKSHQPLYASHRRSPSGVLLALVAMVLQTILFLFAITRQHDYSGCDIATPPTTLQQLGLVAASSSPLDQGQAKNISSGSSSSFASNIESEQDNSKNNKDNNNMNNKMCPASLVSSPARMMLSSSGDNGDNGREGGDGTAPSSSTTGQPTTTTTTTTTTMKRCALLFFGAARRFDKLLPTIRQNILAQNPTCDVYAHTYDIKDAPSGRAYKNQDNAEVVAKVVDSRQVYELTPHVHITTMDEFHARRNLTWFRQHHHKRWGPCCITTDNLIKQWHSIQSVWDYMEGCTNNRTSYNYDRVGLFRLDAFYPTLIPNIVEDTRVAVIPSFAGGSYKMNDRMFYGDYRHAQAWASKRFDRVEPYVTYYSQKAQRHGGYHNAAQQGIHSETFLYDLMRAYKIAIVYRNDICFWRIRSNGMLTTYDCTPNGLSTTTKNISSTSNDIDDGGGGGTGSTTLTTWPVAQQPLPSSMNENWFAGLTCCWNCTEDHPNPAGPCI